MDLIINSIKLERAFLLLEKLKTLFYEVFDLIKNEEIQLENTSIKDSLKESILYSKFRVSLVGIESVGKSTILNGILGENILPTNVMECTKRGVIIQYQNTDDFYLYKIKWICKKRDLNDIFYFENEKDYICKGVDNIRSYLIKENNNNNKVFMAEEFFFIIKGKLKIFDFIKVEKELINRIEFIDLPRIDSKVISGNSSQFIENIIKYSNCLIYINTPNTIDYIGAFYSFLDLKKESFWKKDFYERCLFIINKADILGYGDDIENSKKLLIKNLRKFDKNINDSDLRIGSLSGELFMRYLEKYNYFEKIENDPNFFFEKQFKEFKEKNYPYSFEKYFLKYLRKIEESFELDLEEEEEEIMVPEEYKDKLINSLKDIKIEMNDKELNKIINKVYCVHQQFKKINSQKNISSFLIELETFLMNSFQRQKENFKLYILDLLKFSDLLFENKLIIKYLKNLDKFRLYNSNEISEILEELLNSQNDIIKEGENKIKLIIEDERNNINQRLKEGGNDINKAKENLLNKITKIGEEIFNFHKYKLHNKSILYSIIASSYEKYISKNEFNIDFEKIKKIINNLPEKENSFFKKLLNSKESKYKTELIDIEEKIKNEIDELKKNLSLGNETLREEIISMANKKNEIKEKEISAIEMKYKEKFEKIKNEMMNLF